MTKHVRIENADTSSHKVRVRVYEKSGIENGPDHFMGEWLASNPCEIVEQYIHANRYLVIDEG